MISNALLKFAAAHDWHAAEEDKYVFGKFNDYCFTAMTSDALTSYFVPLAGISPESLLDLSQYIENEHFPLKLVDYEMTDNFLHVRAKDTLFNSTAKQIERFLSNLTEKLKELDLDPNNCIICGQEAELESLYVGLYGYSHPDCVTSGGIDFTAPFNKDKEETEEYLILERDEEDEEFVAFAPNEEDEQIEIPSLKKLEELAEEMEEYSDDLINDLAELCAIPSVEGEAEEGAPFGSETVEVLQTFLKQAEQLGFRTKNVNNMAGYAEFGPLDAEEMIACVCHLDIVPAGDGWKTDPFELTIEDGKVIARGVNDDKGPALAALYAMRALKDDPDFEPNKRIRIIVGLNEETGSKGMAYYVNNEEIPTMGFTADANFPAIYAEKGICRLNFTLERCEQDEIKYAKAGTAVNMVPSQCNIQLKDGSNRDFAGVTAHGSRPELGVNAISVAVRNLGAEDINDSFINFYQKYFANEIDGSSLGLKACDESGPTSINAGMLSIDDEKAQLEIDVRYPVSFDIETALEELKKKLAADNISLEVKEHMEPLYNAEDSPLISQLMQVYNEGTGTSGRALAIGGGTYARAVPNICAFGPVFPGDEDVNHQANEWVLITKLLASATLYRDAFRKLSDIEAE